MVVFSAIFFLFKFMYISYNGEDKHGKVYI